MTVWTIELGNAQVLCIHKTQASAEAHLSKLDALQGIEVLLNGPPREILRLRERTVADWMPRR